MKKKLAIIIVCMMMLTGIGCVATGRSAAAASYSNIVIAQDGLDVFELIPGTATQVVLPIKATKDFVMEADFEALLPENAPLTIM